jgi:phage host-nuclease inhibitor protein Gam
MGDVNDIIRAAELAPAPPLRIGELPADLEAYEDVENPEVRGGGWKIETIQSADWALARLSELQAEADSIDEQAKAGVARIRARAEALKAKVARGIGYFEFKLLEYAETHRKAMLGGGKKKSRSFIHGTVGWRTKNKGGRLVVEDAKALEAWLVAQPVERGLFRQKIEPELRALQALFADTGEIPPGCNVEEEIDEPYVKVEAPETALVGR